MIDHFLEENGKDRCNALMIMDVDYFKQVNDTYGHMVGDKVLKILTSSCKTVQGEGYCRSYRW